MDCFNVSSKSYKLRLGALNSLLLIQLDDLSERDLGGNFFRTFAATEAGNKLIVLLQLSVIDMGIRQSTSAAIDFFKYGILELRDVLVSLFVLDVYYDGLCLAVLRVVAPSCSEHAAGVCQDPAALVQALLQDLPRLSVN